MFNIIKNFRYKTPYIKKTKINMLDFHGSYSSREGNAIGSIIVHWTGLPAGQNNDFVYRYFNATDGVSSHFCIDQEGSIDQFVPLSQTAYHAGNWKVNLSSVGVEVNTMIEKPGIPQGSYTVNTYDSQVELCAALLVMYKLRIDALKRHYDITGKRCPALFVDYPKLWTAFKRNVSIKMNELIKFNKKVNYFYI